MRVYNGPIGDTTRRPGSRGCLGREDLARPPPPGSVRGAGGARGGKRANDYIRMGEEARATKFRDPYPSAR